MPVHTNYKVEVRTIFNSSGVVSHSITTKIIVESEKHLAKSSLLSAGISMEVC